jgi:hypothetical protein
MAYLGKEPSAVPIDASDIPDNSISAAKIIDGTITAADIGTLSGDLSLADSKKIKLGDGDDLQIHHTSGNSFIEEAGTGNLVIKTNGAAINMEGNSGADYIARFIQDGACMFYDDNSLKLTTTSTGIDVTGSTTTDSLVLQGGITEQETTKTASFTPNLTTDGTIFDVSGTITITMPTATAGKSFTIIDSGSGTLSWGGTIKWSGGTAPSPSGITIYSFISNGTNWYGMQAGTGFA